MDTTSSSIENVSDTALWVAYARALESERPDALFHDPYARELVGERGAAITKSMRNGKSLAWNVSLRTRLIDEVLLETIEKHGCDTVLSLAAGLDTRVYRLELPSSLHWIEVDLPAILTYKAEKLADRQPKCYLKCYLEQVKLDLADIPARQALFERISVEGKNVFVLMEGLSIYLTREQLASLVTDLHTHPEFHWLLTEFITAASLQYMRRAWEKRLAQGNAPIRLLLDDSELFYREHGWESVQTYLMAEESYRYNRELSFFWLIELATFNNAPKRKEMYRQMGGFSLLKRSD